MTMPGAMGTRIVNRFTTAAPSPRNIHGNLASGIDEVLKHSACCIRSFVKDCCQTQAAPTSRFKHRAQATKSASHYELLPDLPAFPRPGDSWPSSPHAFADNDVVLFSQTGS